MVTAANLNYQFPSYSLPAKPSEFRQRLISLIDTMQTIGGSTINSLTGLFLAIFADEKDESHKYQLAMLAEKTLYWLKNLEKKKAKSQRKVDMYELYRTDDEWLGDIGLSKYKLRKLRDKLAPIITCKSKLNLARTKIMHYKLDGEALLTAIAKVYNRSTIYLRGFLFDRVTSKPDFKPSPPKTLKPDFKPSSLKASKSLTTIPDNVSLSKDKETNQTTKHAVVVNLISLNPEYESFAKKHQEPVGTMPALSEGDEPIQVTLLVKAGIWRNTAKTYTWIPHTTLSNLIAQAQAKRDSGELRQTMPKYLAGTLKIYAQNIKEEFKRALAHNPKLNFEDFVQQQSVGERRAVPNTESNNQFAGLTWRDVVTESPNDYYTGGRWAENIES